MDPRTEATLVALMQKIDAAGGVDELLKAFTLPGSSTQGLVRYSLEAPSKKLFPVITPLRNRIPRDGGGEGTAANWRAITQIDVNRVPAGVSEGNRGGVIATRVKEFSAKFITLGLEDYVTFEMDSASRTFEDTKALAVLNLLKSLYMQEEVLTVGGNNSVTLGTPTVLALSQAAGTGTLLNSTAYHVRCVALTLPGYMQSKVGDGSGVPMTLTRTNADASTDSFGGGSSKISASVNLTTSTAGATVSAEVTPVAGAYAYAWFFGTDNSAACLLHQITTINSATFKALANGGVAWASVPTGYGAKADDFTSNNTDNSTNALVYDGILSLIAAANSGAVLKTMATGVRGTGTGLTSDGSGGIAEFNDVLKQMWDENKVAPSEILVSSQEVKSVTKLVMGNGGAPLVRFVGDLNRDAQPVGSNDNWTDAMGSSAITAGAIVRNYLNPFTMAGGNVIPIRLHPNVPPGTVIFWTDSLPYPLSNVPNVIQYKDRRGYYQLEWPLRSRKYEYGVYIETLLQCYATFAFGAITNIAP